jgi:mono/diheme cytochrome c family protein
MAAAILATFLGVAVAQPNQAKPSFDYWHPDWMVRELWRPGDMPKGMRVRLLRHMTFTQMGVPKDYESARSKVSGDAAIKAGARLYAKRCAPCHGQDGMGERAPARSLHPLPALLALMISRPIAVDEYVVWAIADGGAPCESEMPAFKDKMTRQQIWEVTAFMRAGFPTPSEAR